MKRAIAVLLAVPLLAACGGDYDPEKSPTETYPTTVPVDGRIVQCVIYDDNRYEQGGIDCDWTKP